MLLLSSSGLPHLFIRKHFNYAPDPSFHVLVLETSLRSPPLAAVHKRRQFVLCGEVVQGGVEEIVIIGVAMCIEFRALALCRECVQYKFDFR